LLRGAGIDE
jgi:hypothetical protein